MTTPNTGLVEVPKSAFPEAEDLNESLRRVDVLVQCRVRSEDVTSPPPDAVQGDAYIVPVPATDDWATRERQIAYYTASGWRYIVPRAGFRAKVLDSGKLREYDAVNAVWGPALNGAGDTANLPDAVGGIGAALVYELELTEAGLLEITLLDDVTLVFTGGEEGKVSVVRLVVRQDDTGGRVITWPASAFWPGGSPPDVSLEPRIVNVYEIETHDGGLSHWCRLLAKAVYSGSDLPPTFPSSDDPLASSTPHLLHFDGADGSTTVTDEKGATWTGHVDTHDDGIFEIDTAEARFGASSAHFIGGDGAGGFGNPRGGNYISTPGTVDNDMTVADFTIEGWAKLDLDPLTSGASMGLLFVRGLDSSGAGLIVKGASNGSIAAFVRPDQGVHPGIELTIDGEGMTDGMGTYAFSSSAFKHWHFGRRGNKFYYGVNGRTRNSDLSLLGLAGWFATNVFGAIPGADGEINVAGVDIANALSDQCSTMWLDELRITVGACRYVDDYVPPALPFAVPAAFTAPAGEDADGWGPRLYTDDVANDTQRRLNIVAGPNVVLDQDGGDVTVTASGGGGGGGGGTSPETHPAIPDPADDEFEFGSSIDTAGARFTGANAWAWRNQGGATAVVASQGALVLTAPASSGNDLRIVEQSISGAGRWRARLAMKSSGGFSTAGICLINSGNGRLITISKQENSQATESSRYNSVTSFNGGVNGPVAAHFGGIYGQCYVELEYDGTNIVARLSGSGIDGSFFTYRNEAASDFLGTPDKIGIFANSNNSGDSAIAIVDWFRRMA